MVALSYVSVGCGGYSILLHTYPKQYLTASLSEVMIRCMTYTLYQPTYDVDRNWKNPLQVVNPSTIMKGVSKFHVQDARSIYIFLLTLKKSIHHSE